jgi:hypothetical protein
MITDDAFFFPDLFRLVERSPAIEHSFPSIPALQGELHDAHVAPHGWHQAGEDH